MKFHIIFLTHCQQQQQQQQLHHIDVPLSLFGNRGLRILRKVFYTHKQVNMYTFIPARLFLCWLLSVVWIMSCFHPWIRRFCNYWLKTTMVHMAHSRLERFCYGFGIYNPTKFQLATRLMTVSEIQCKIKYVVTQQLVSSVKCTHIRITW